MHPDLLEAIQAAVKVADSPCWIWQLETSRLGTLKRIEVPREKIQATKVPEIWCIQNRFEAERLEPVAGQLYFSDTEGLVQVYEYRRGEQDGQALHQLGRFAREASEPIRFTDPDTVARYLHNHIYTSVEAQEEMWTLLLNSRGQVTYEVMIYRGTVNSIEVRPVEVLREAIRLNAPSLILSHSHPSGDPEPSEHDLIMTKRLSETAKLLSIELLDHLIMAKNSWVSLRQRGMV